MNFKIILTVLLLVCYGALYAQPPCNLNSPEAGLNCDDFGPPLCDIRDINGFCGRPPRRNELNADGWCGNNSVVSNGSVFRFLVNSDNVNIKVYWENCGFFASQGIQAAIFEGCSSDFTTPIVCDDSCTPPFSNPVEFDFVGRAGQEYALLVDGCFANRCDYIVEIITDNPDPVVRVEDWVDGSAIQGPGISNNELCNGLRRSCGQYVVAERTGATSYLWFLNGDLILENNDPFVNLDNADNRLVNSELCVQAINLCDSNEVVCIDFIGKQGVNTEIDTCICPIDLPEFRFRGDQFASMVNGLVYEDTDNCGCVDTTFFSLSLVDIDTLVTSWSVCQTDLDQGLIIDDQVDLNPVTEDGERRLTISSSPTEYVCDNAAILTCPTYRVVTFLLADIIGSIMDTTLDCSSESVLYTIDELRFYPSIDELDLSIEWQSATGNTLGTEPSISIRDTGLYFLNINYNRIDADSILNACSFRDSFRVDRDIESGVRGPSISVMNETCAGLSNGVLSIRNPIDEYRYELNGINISDDLLVDTLAPGDYELITRSEKGCIFRDTFTIGAAARNKYQISVSDTLIFFGDVITVTIDSTNRDDLISTQWLDGRGVDLDCSPCAAIAYKPSFNDSLLLIVEDVDGCVDSSSISITVLNDNVVYIPNIFSPNATLDENQYFSVFADQTVETIESVDIYSRSGALVYSVQNALPVEQLWDGTYNGQTASSGVYVYRTVVRFINGAQRVYTGDVTLVY